MPSEVSPWFLELARCPAGGSRLTAAEDSLLARLNEGIVAGKVVNTSGNKIERPVEGGLLDSPPTRLYPIRNGIVSLVVDDSIPLAANGFAETGGDENRPKPDAKAKENPL